MHNSFETTVETQCLMALMISQTTQISVSRKKVTILGCTSKCCGLIQSKAETVRDALYLLSAHRERVPMSTICLPKQYIIESIKKRKM